MPRPLSASRPHPSPRFRDTIRLRQGRRGDDIWSATFCIDGKWQTTRPIGLGKSDFDEACEVARDKFSAMDGRGLAAVLKPATRPTAPPWAVYALAICADRAVAKLEDQAAKADALVPGKEHNFRQIIGRIRVLKDRWGHTDISKLTEVMLEDWIADEYWVEDRAATVANPALRPARRC